jgi:hypothetical protein
LSDLKTDRDGICTVIEVPGADLPVKFEIVSEWRNCVETMGMAPDRATLVPIVLGKELHRLKAPFPG